MKHARTPTDWWDALGRPVSQGGMDAAYRLCLEEGLPAFEAEVVLNLVRHEIEHDEPERAQKCLLGWLADHGTPNQTFVFRVLATICTGGES